MPDPSDLPSVSLSMAAGVSMIALFLGLRQWYERRAREADLPEIDRIHYTRQDVRRWAGVAILLVIACLIPFGSRLPPKIGDRANGLFMGTWIVVLVLIVLLLILALLDWIATRIYALRHRRAILHEQMEAIRLEAQRATEARLCRTAKGKSPHDPASPHSPED